MKANDIQIGDYLRRRYTCADTGREVVIDFQVTEIRKNGDSLYVCSKKGVVCKVEDAEPIPLTVEILEKNGFENDFYEEESVVDYHAIRLEGYSLKHNIGEIDGYLVTWCNGGVNVTTDLNGCVQKDISYLHQLQHAFNLCGIDKEIALPKED